MSNTNQSKEGEYPTEAAAEASRKYFAELRRAANPSASPVPINQSKEEGSFSGALGALRACVEHMEWSTPQGKAAYEAARECLGSFSGGAATEFKPDWANYEQGRKDGRAEVREDTPSASEWLRLRQPETYAAWLAGNLTPEQVSWMAGWDACRAALSSQSEAR